MPWEEIAISAKDRAFIDQHKKANPAPEGWCYVDDVPPPLDEVVQVKIDDKVVELVAHWEMISGIAMAQAQIPTRQELSWCYPGKVWDRKEPMYGAVSLRDLWRPLDRPAPKP